MQGDNTRIHLNAFDKTSKHKLHKLSQLLERLLLQETTPKPPKIKLRKAKIDALFSNSS
jgi:hypothetical protein